MKTVVSALIAAANVSSPAGAQTTTATQKSRVEAGFAVDRLERIDQMLQRYIDEN
jgi:hypothetical protein